MGDPITVERYHPKYQGDLRSFLGAADHAVINVGSSDQVVADTSSRFFTCDTEGIIKFDYLKPNGETTTR